MSRGSALARVIGLTRSLSPLAHADYAQPEPDPARDDHDDGDHHDDHAASGRDATDAVVAGALTEATARPDDTAPVSVADETGADKVTPALAHVTLVGTTAPAVAADPIRDTATAGAIEAIEADIASLLSTLDGTGTPPHSPADDEDEAAAAEWHEGSDDRDSPTLVLLSELDRLWRADPAVGNSYMR